MGTLQDFAKSTVTREFDLGREWTLEEAFDKLNDRAAAYLVSAGWWI